MLPIHNNTDSTIEKCIKYMSNRIYYTDATFSDFLKDEKLVKLMGPEQLFLCYKAAKILLDDSTT